MDALFVPELPRPERVRRLFDSVVKRAAGLEKRSGAQIRNVLLKYEMNKQSCRSCQMQSCQWNCKDVAPAKCVAEFRSLSFAVRIVHFMSWAFVTLSQLPFVTGMKSRCMKGIRRKLMDVWVFFRSFLECVAVIVSLDA